jgi:SAM-dependent methyltransferase
MIYGLSHANHYDLFYPDKPYREEAAYAVDLVKARSPEAKTILDLGCGTGLRSLEFARLGFEVLGVDQSEAMLAAAREHLAAAKDLSSNLVGFQLGDVTSFRAPSGHDAVLSLFHVFSYLTSMESLEQALNSAFASLNSGGVFLIDYWHGPAVLKDPPVFRKKAVEKGPLKIEKTTAPEVLPEKHLVRLQVSLRVTDRDSGVSDESDESYLMRYWFPEELEGAMDRIGFRSVRHYAWMTQSAPEPTSWQACTVAIKP